MSWGCVALCIIGQNVLKWGNQITALNTLVIHNRQPLGDIHCCQLQKPNINYASVLLKKALVIELIVFL